MPLPRGARRGNYMMIMPFYVPVLVGFAALSVDISYINMAHSQAQHVADAASHAALVGYRVGNDTTVGDAAAQYILDNNLVGNRKAVLTQPIEYGEWDYDTRTFDPTSPSINAARAAVTRHEEYGNPLDLFFAPILGYNTANVEGRGVTAARSRQVMIVQDVSCSFGGPDIVNAREADLAFLDYMHDHPYPNDMLGMVMFGGLAWYPPMYDLSEVEGNYAPMRAKFKKLDYCKNLPASLDSTPDTGVKCSTTQARGLILAREQFLERGDRREFQAVIIVSDGEPTSGMRYAEGQGAPGATGAAEDASIRAANQMWGTDPGGFDATSWTYEAYGCGDDNDPSGSGPWSNDLDDCADRVHDTTFHGGVHMWSVYFNADGDAASEDWMAQHMVKGLGRSYAVSDSSELTNIMVEIASSIPVVIAE